MRYSKLYQAINWAVYYLCQLCWSLQQTNDTLHLNSYFPECCFKAEQPIFCLFQNLLLFHWLSVNDRSVSMMANLYELVKSITALAGEYCFVLQHPIALVLLELKMGPGWVFRQRAGFYIFGLRTGIGFYIFGLRTGTGFYIFNLILINFNMWVLFNCHGIISLCT